MLNVTVPAPNGWVAAPPARGFSCLTVELASATRVNVEGELDLATSPQLDDALHRAEADARLIVLDLRRLAFMDCSGLRVILAAHDRARRPGCRLVVVRGPTAVQRVFTLTAVHRELEFVDLPPSWAADPVLREVVPA